jgi:hypothetical protein
MPRGVGLFLADVEFGEEFLKTVLAQRRFPILALIVS